MIMGVLVVINQPQILKHCDFPTITTAALREVKRVRLLLLRPHPQLSKDTGFTCDTL